MLSLRQIADLRAADMLERDPTCVTDFARDGASLHVTFLCAAEAGACPRPCVFTTESLTLEFESPREAARARQRIERAARAATLE